VKKILINGKIYINPGGFCSALCIENGLIEAVGDMRDAEGWGRGEILDLKGKTVVPGFNDSHIHLLHCWFFLERANVSEARSVDDVIDICRQYLRDHPEKKVLVGRGWSQDRFTGEKRLLNRYDLDRISEDIPVILTRNCGHVAAVNSRVIETLNIGRGFAVEAGGAIGLEGGVPDGVLYETAVNQVKYLINEPYSRIGVYQDLGKIAKLVNACGITSVSTNDLYIGYPDAVPVEGGYHMYARNNPTLRVNHQISFHDPGVLKKRIREGYDRSGNPAFNRYGPVKLFADGSLGGRTALMREPYADRPDTRGSAVLTREELGIFMRLASEKGIQCVTHAIGDAAVDHVLEAIDGVNPSGENLLRHGIIHAAFTRREQLLHMAKTRIPVLVQPVNLWRGAGALSAVVGNELASTSGLYKTMIDLGIQAGYGSDAPIAPWNVMQGIHCAVNRQNQNFEPPGGDKPQERVSVEQAVDAFTLKGAWISGEENVKGRLLPGYYADLAVLSDDIFTIPKEKIRDVRVEMTMVGGRIVWQDLFPQKV
jgi:predicted amidohydrolase YtcJ